MSKAEIYRGTKSPGSFILTDSITEVFPGDINYDSYIKDVSRDFNIVKSFFSDLKLCTIPTLQIRESFIYGWIIPPHLQDVVKTVTDKRRYGLYIIAVYPSEYGNKDVDIVVEDPLKSIDWSKIPEKHRHKATFRRRPVLCTHHPKAEINDVPKEFRTVKILSSAWKLYDQYREYLRTKKWTLPDRRHGSEADLQLYKEGYLRH